MNDTTASSFDSLGLPGALILLVPFFVTIVGTPIARNIALRLGIVDAPVSGSSKIHEHPTPYLGGLPLCIALTGGLIIIFHQTGKILPEGFQPWLAISSILFIFLVGLWDDVMGMIPGIKMLLLAVAGTALFFAGGQVSFIPESWGVSGRIIAWILTLFWILGITNSANLMDNMNGLAAGMGIVAGLAMLAISIIGSDTLGIGLSLIFIGSLLGYIPYNYPKAQIFFGDAGSIVLGFYLCFLGLIVGRIPPPQNFHPLSHTLAPIIVLGVFIFDTFFVAFSRGKRKISFWWGGKDHTSHRLVNFGFSKPMAVFLCWVLGAIFGGLAILVKISSWWLASIITAAILLAGIWFWRQLDKIPVENVVIGASNIREKRLKIFQPRDKS